MRAADRARPTKELVVESIAFSLTGTLGLDTVDYSIPYLTSWSTNTALDVLEATAKLINRLANRIEDAIPDESPGDAPADTGAIPDPERFANTAPLKERR